MNTYKFKDVNLGLSKEFDIIITEEMMDEFEKISGDINPMHKDFNYAQSYRMNGRVVYGLLTSTFYSTLVGVYLPGKFAFLHSIDIQFLKPVYIGDIIKVKGKIVEKNETFNQIYIKGSIINQNGIKVSRAKIKVGVLE